MPKRKKLFKLIFAIFLLAAVFCAAILYFKTMSIFQTNIPNLHASSHTRQKISSLLNSFSPALIEGDFPAIDTTFAAEETSEENSSADADADNALSFGFRGGASSLCNVYKKGREMAKKQNENSSENSSQEEQSNASNSQSNQTSGKSSRFDGVDPKDYQDAMAIASKVDTGYILGLLSGGLTTEERRELKSYLTKRLSGAEIARGLQLYAKYSHLM